MAYGIYLKLDQTQWREFDYSAEDKLTGTVYTDKDLTTPKNLSGYTIMLRISKRWHIHDRFGKTADIVSASAGTWSYPVGEGHMPRNGFYRFEVELSKSGTSISTKPVDFVVTRGTGA